MYFSAVLQKPDNARQSFESGFAQYLARTFSYTGGVTCSEQSGAANAQTLLTNTTNAWRSAQKKVVMTGWTQAAPAGTGSAGTANSQGNVSGQKTNTSAAGAGSGGKTSKSSTADQTLDVIFGAGSSGGSDAGGASASKGASGANAARGSGTAQSASGDTGSGGIAGAASKITNGIAGVFGRKKNSSDSSGEAGAKPGTEGAKGEAGAAKPKQAIASQQSSEALPKGALGAAKFADAKTNTKLIVSGRGRKATQVAFVADLTNQNDPETLVQSADVWKDAFIVDDRGDRHLRTKGYFLNIDGEERPQLDINKDKSARFVLMFDGVPTKVQTITLRSNAGRLNVPDIRLIAH
jgi:hypothetical protein